VNVARTETGNEIDREGRKSAKVASGWGLVEEGLIVSVICANLNPTRSTWASQ